MSPARTVRLTPGKRVLFLTKDPDLVRRQLSGELNLHMKDLKVEDLLDDINTDAMTPAWVCFDWDPAEIAKNAYAGLIVEGKRLFGPRALLDGNFEVIVSGHRKGVGSSRETAAQCEKFCGVRISVAASFAPIHVGNNVNLGTLMADHAMLERLQAGESLPLDAFTQGYAPVQKLMVEHGGLFPLADAIRKGGVKVPVPSHPARPMTMAEKILAGHLQGAKGAVYLKPGDSVCVKVDAGYSHEFTTAQVHAFLKDQYGPEYKVADASKFAVFEDHLLYADQVAANAPYKAKIQVLRDQQRVFQKHTGVRDYSARDGRSPGICHQVAREAFIDPGDLVQATDSHTTMGGGSNALAWGVGSTEYAGLIQSGLTFVTVPESIRFEFSGKLRPGVTAKDVILLLLRDFAKPSKTLNRSMEFGGPGLATLSPDERATLANMATECSARAGIVDGDEALVDWIAARRPGVSKEALRRRLVTPDKGAEYAGGIHAIDLSGVEPMLATPGDPDKGIPSDPTNGATVEEVGEVPIDIAYGGSCTAGKEDDLDFYARVMREALKAGRRVAPGVAFYIQFGSEAVAAYARTRGYLEVFEKTGVTLIPPGCGACIGCGPGVSEKDGQVTVSAINRNFKGRSGPGRLYLASPLTVAASAVEGRIAAYREGMFS